jgi:hypothetical protein
MNKKFYWLIGGAILVILLIIFLSRLFIVSPKSAAKTAVALGAAITVQGTIFCVPRKSAGSECAIGVEDKNGKYYALVGASGAQIDPASATTGSQITISGNLVTNSDLPKNYDAYGVIQVSQ